MKKILLWGIILFLLLGIDAMFFGVIYPVYIAGHNLTLSGQLTMEQQPEGSWQLSWPAVEKADRYRIELVTPEGEVVYRDFTGGENRYLLPELPDDRILSVQVTPAVRLRTLMGEDYRYSESSLQGSACFTAIPAAAPWITVNGDDKTVKVEMTDNTRWQYQLLDGSGAVLAEATLSPESPMVLSFGEEPGIAMPQAGETYILRTRAVREEPGILLCGVPSGDFRITEESLQYRQLNAKLENTAKNTFRITWGETRGDHYEVQMLDPASGTWTTLAKVAQDKERSFVDLLEPNETKQYRVVAVDASGAELVVSEEQMTATGRNRIQYATVWPVKDLAVYSSASKGTVIGTATGGAAYCVLEESRGMFAVRFDDGIGYIDSSYCMINLPEYLGDLCGYNIANSVSAIYAIHEFAIRNVTGVVTRGYENILQEDGSYLVPLLYPAAKRLLNAAESARQHGYRLKIYDSFRPHTATLEIYELTSQIMADPIPPTTYTGVAKEEMELPAPRPGWDYLSLGWLMTGFNYEQNSFLAKGGSAHNLGIALDLTLETWDTREEIRMQTSMHDLSQYSVLGQNNEAADLLGDIMHKAGFEGLISEWWHFQDNRAKGELSLPYVSQGVNAACWVKDDTGWRYRDAKGSFRRGETAVIDGREYTFDQNGYVTE